VLAKGKGHFGEGVSPLEPHLAPHRATSGHGLGEQHTRQALRGSLDPITILRQVVMGHQPIHHLEGYPVQDQGQVVLRGALIIPQGQHSLNRGGNTIEMILKQKFGDGTYSGGYPYFSSSVVGLNFFNLKGGKFSYFSRYPDKNKLVISADGYVWPAMSMMMIDEQLFLPKNAKLRPLTVEIVNASGHPQKEDLSFCMHYCVRDDRGRRLYSQVAEMGSLVNHTGNKAFTLYGYNESGIKFAVHVLGSSYAHIFHINSSLVKDIARLPIVDIPFLLSTKPLYCAVTIGGFSWNATHVVIKKDNLITVPLYFPNNFSRVPEGKHSLIGLSQTYLMKAGRYSYQVYSKSNLLYEVRKDFAAGSFSDIEVTHDN